MKKILIVGWGRSGKDEAARFMDNHLGVRYAGSTSWAALPLMAELLKTHPQLAWEHRHENRELWKAACDQFRADNPLLLMQRAFHATPEGRVITGVRDKVELLAAKSRCLFDHIVWIDRTGIPEDPTVTYDASYATDYIRNDGDLRQFHRNVTRWAVQNSIGITPSLYASELLLDPQP
jgi:hypothetical protein